MKKFFMIAALTLAAGPVVIDPVFAADRGTYCHSTGIADGGYELIVAANGKTAVLSEQTFTGPREIAQLVCKRGKIQRFPDAINNYLICREDGALDNSVMARLYSGGIAGIHQASIRAVTVVGELAHEEELEFGRLNCR